MNADPGPDRKTAAAAMSAGTPQRRTGVRRTMRCWKRSSEWRSLTRSVSTRPGHRVLTVTPPRPARQPVSGSWRSFRPCRPRRHWSGCRPPIRWRGHVHHSTPAMVGHRRGRSRVSAKATVSLVWMVRAELSSSTSVSLALPESWRASRCGFPVGGHSRYSVIEGRVPVSRSSRRSTVDLSWAMTRRSSSGSRVCAVAVSPMVRPLP